MNNHTIQRQRIIISDDDVFNAFKRWASPGLKQQKMNTSFVREAVCLIHPSKAILQYDVRQKLKNMAARGLVTEINAASNSTLWMISEEVSNGQN